MSGKQLLMTMALAVILASCGPGNLFSGDQALEGREWDSNKKISFDVDVKSTTTYYDFFIDFRHNEDYPYSDIYLLFGIDFPNGKSTNDTIHYIMQSPDGKWLGKKSGSIIDNHVLVRHKTAFPVAGIYKFHLGHLMRDQKLGGIEDVGISITPKE
jgi:gliding motility-associated lipoprotein GldH